VQKTRVAQIQSESNWSDKQTNKKRIKKIKQKQRGKKNARALLQV